MAEWYQAVAAPGVTCHHPDGEVFAAYRSLYFANTEEVA